MSDTAYSVVRLDVLDEAEITAVAERAEAFLRSRGLLGEVRETGWAPGPRFREVLDPQVPQWAAEKGGGYRMERLDYNHLEVDRRWGDHFAIEAFEAPACPACGTAAVEDDCYAGLDDWVLRREEPELTCPGCGTVTPQGDWVGDRANACGAPAVVFHNWDELDPAFVAELRRVVGGRTQVVWQHS